MRTAFIVMPQPRWLFGCTLLALAVIPAQAHEARAQEGGAPAGALGMAVLPLPPAQREIATVIAPAGGAWTILREGTGDFICLADDPAEERFHVACYHHSLEPYMARGRELRAAGVTGRESITKRWDEIEAGELQMPDHPAAMYSLTGPAGWEGDVDALGALTVLYVAYATPEKLGIPTEPEPGRPWLMFPGRPTAHIMITP